MNQERLKELDEITSEMMQGKLDELEALSKIKNKLAFFRGDYHNFR